MSHPNSSDGLFSTFCGDGGFIDGIDLFTFDFPENSSIPDISRCAQNTFLVWIPSIIIIPCISIWIPYLCRLPNAKVRRSFYNIFKLMMSFLIFIAYIVNLIRSSVGHYSSYHDVVTKYAVQAVTMALLTSSMRYEHRRGIHSSGVVSVAWSLLLVFGVFEFRSRIINATQHDAFQTYSFFLSYFLIFMEFVCCFFSDLSALGDKKTSSQKGENQCPEERASFFSRMTYFWITSFMWKGYRKTLTFEDLFDLRGVDRCEAIMPRFEKYWREEVIRAKVKMGGHKNKGKAANAVSNHNNINVNEDKKQNNNNAAENERVQMLPLHKDDDLTPKEKKDAKPEESEFKKRVSLMRVMGRLCGGDYLLAGLFKLLYDLIAFLHPILLSYLLTFIKSRTSPTWLGMMIVTAMLLVSFVRTFFVQQYWYICYVVGQHLRTAIVGIVYRKALRLSNTARKEATVGEIVNLMSVDAQKFDDAPLFIHMIWSTPVTIAISIYMLWQFLGPSVMAGLLCMLVMIPINGFIATRNKRLQVEQMKFKDSRIKMITEILNGIKVLKLYAWEKYFLNNVSAIRNKEIQVLRTSQMLSAASTISWFMTPFFVALTTFAVYVTSSPDNVLDSNKAFVSLSLFNMLNYPISIMPMVINSLIQVSVSTKRLKKYLMEDELNKYVEEEGCVDPGNDVEINDANFSWGKDDPYVLKNINLSIKKGALVAIVGQVGSGKSSLISAICGEMDVSTGNVRTKGSVAYVAQQAWIQNATIRDNVLFSRPYSNSSYRKVVDACALQPDFQVLPASDQTEVGEKGINLSGGQKQRLSLARALYQNANIYLLDDPLSAVDTHVGEHIFNNVIGRNGLLQKKTRILVMNQVSYLPQMDLIVVLKDGYISEVGTYKEMITRKSQFSSFVQLHLKQDEEKVDDSVGDGRGSSSSEASLTRRATFHKSLSTKSEESGVEYGKLLTDETALTGSIKLSVFARYIKACRIMPFLSFLFFYVFFVVSQISSNLWLSGWSNDPPTNDTSLRDYRIGVYGGFGVAQVIGVVGMSLSLAILCTRSSEKLHSILLFSILRAPMSFFDTTPQGRIINRFSRDVDILDVTIPITLRIWFATMSGVISTFFVISYTLPIFIAALIPLALFYYFVQRFYISTSRQLRRLDSNFRSPIYAHFSETIVGCGSIRAYRHQERFIRTSNEMVDRSLMTNYPMIISFRWLGIWLETIGTSTLVFTALFAVLQKHTIDVGLAGLSLSYSLQITLSLNMFVRMMSELETNIVSVERIDEYINCSQEAPLHTSIKPSPSWPEKGCVVFDNYSTRYREKLDFVLKNFSCQFDSGEKIGIVGRTGAGKSSMALALFRVIEPSFGSITIDEVNISTLGLYDLRSRLTIIPQDPILFSGTLRMNIDPSGMKSDDEIWDALGHANLKNFVSAQPDKLMTMCVEGGGNLSVGQRQLVCLARALLRRTNILVLDEATAAIDLESDSFIQGTIRNEFNKCTVITIAHRLNTIIDYDKILVLEEGRLVEFDSPKNLMSKPLGQFYAMAKSANLVR